MRRLYLQGALDVCLNSAQIMAVVFMMCILRSELPWGSLGSVSLLMVCNWPNRFDNLA